MSTKIQNIFYAAIVIALGVYTMLGFTGMN